MNLKKIRKEKKISQQKIANELKISQGNYCKYENGTIEPNIEIIIKLARYFNVTTDELLGIEKEKTLTEKNNLIKKLDNLTELECHKLSIFADGLISNRVESTHKIFKVIEKEES